MAHPLPNRLKEARLRKDISQRKLGELIGIDPSIASSRMNHYEKGRHFPDFSLVQKISQELGVPTAYFYCEDDELAGVIANWKKPDSEKNN